jgi:rubrerythrin
LTISVLQTLYTDEFQSRYTYLAYSERARLEDYPAIALLFLAMADSDAVNLRNFSESLADLGFMPRKQSTPETEILDTGENLKRSVKLELEKIDQYSRYLERVRTERHGPATQSISYALESEKKHREHLKRIEKNTGFRFKMLAKYMRSKDVRFYVCQQCGYTVVRLPEEKCPICGRPSSIYREV